MEISSLSCEEAPGCSIVVAVFDIPCSPDMIAVRSRPLPVQTAAIFGIAHCLQCSVLIEIIICLGRDVLLTDEHLRICPYEVYMA